MRRALQFRKPHRRCAKRARPRLGLCEPRARGLGSHPGVTYPGKKIHTSGDVR